MSVDNIAQILNENVIDDSIVSLSILNLLNTIYKKKYKISKTSQIRNIKCINSIY